jgi:hypothetical protein
VVLSPVSYLDQNGNLEVFVSFSTQLEDVTAARQAVSGYNDSKVEL